MHTKLFRFWCGLAAMLLASFGTAFHVNADNPPWPTAVLVVSLDPYAAEEGSDPATFAVVRVGPADAPLTVQYELGGTAANGDDYDLLSGEVTIPQGAYFAPVTVTPVDDYLVEGSESVVIALQQPAVWPLPYIVTWPAVAAAHIADNDRPPTNTPPVVDIVRPPNGAIFDAYDDILLVARAFDRDGRVRMVEFYDGTNSLGIVTNRPVPVLTDLLSAVDDPTFDLDAELLPGLDANADPSVLPVPGSLLRLLWQDAKPGPHVLTAVATDNDGDSTTSTPVEIKVLDPPPVPVVIVKATDPIAAEPDPTTDYLDTATFKICRRGPTNLPLRVFYRLGGTASNGADYRELPYSAEIPAGERCTDVVVEPIDDLLVEGPESVVLALVPPVCAAIVPPPADCYQVGRAHTARAIIRDTDTPPNRPPLVRLVHPDDGDIFLAPADIKLAALARDYDGYVTQVEFFEGTNSLGVVTNDPASRSADLPPFVLAWTNVPPGRYVLSAVATDNDDTFTRSRPVEIKVVPHIEPPEVNVTATDPVASEPGVLTVIDPAVFSVTRTGNTNWPLAVFYQIDGTASNGVDYQELSGHVLIPAGSAAADIVVNPLDDKLVEGTETVVVRLVPSPIVSPSNVGPRWWYRIGSNYVARAIIRDNDFPPTNLPPRVAIVHPQDGDVFVAPVDIKLAAAAHDPDGWVRMVEFFDGTNSLGVVSNSLSSANGPEPADAVPEQLFRLAWENVVPGPHVLTAKATDNRGASSTSGPVRIRVLPPPRPPVVTIYANDPYASEGPSVYPWPVAEADAASPLRPPDTATFTLVRCGDISEDLTVFYKLEGTAMNGVDYRKLSGEVTIKSGQYRAKIVVDPIDDNLPERTEIVIATLVPIACPAIYPPPPGCYVVGDPSSARAFIFDNDFNHTPKLEIVSPANDDVFRPHSDIDIDVATVDPDGYVWKMQFYANNELIGEQAVNFFVAPPPGQPQRFSMTWTNVPPGGFVLTVKATDDRGATSLSDPVRLKVAPFTDVPVVTIEAVDRVATEPNPLLDVLPDTAKFKVSRTGALGQSLTVFYRIGGTAMNGADYGKLSGEVTIPEKASAAIVEVVPLDDGLVEGTESVILTLIQPLCVLSNVVDSGCYLVGQPGRDIAYIRDNDCPPNHPPKVALVSPANGSVSTAPVDIRLIAQAVDSDGWVETVEFFDGNSSIGVVTNHPLILETTPMRLSDLNTDVLSADSPLPQFWLLWANVPTGGHVLTAVATDNTGNRTRSRPVEIKVLESGHVPIVNVMAVDPIAREGTSNTATFRVHRIGSTNAPLAVFYSVHGSAQNGVDYETIAPPITIPAGNRNARIVITPKDDNVPERIETVVVRLIEPPFGPTTYQIGRPARAGVIILDNDCPIPPNKDLADGRPHLRLAVPKGMPFRLEASTNMLDWEAVVKDIATEDGISFVDDESGEHPARFFRVVQEFGDLEEE